MSLRPLLAAVVAFMVVENVLAEDYSMCRDEGCGDCPVTLASLGTGYPECIIYNTDDVFGGQDFPPSELEDFRAYFDVPQQNTDENCNVIIKSPAERGRTACGVVKYAFHRESCGKLDLAKTFMVQFCCGFCDCSAAGIPNMPGCSAKFGALGGGGSSGPLRLSRNGTLITPAYEGPADSVDETAATSSTDTTTGQPGPARLAAREDKKGVCAGDWTPGPEPHDDSYIRPADGPTIVASEVDGGPEGSEIQITRSRTQSWSTTMEMSLGIADVLSLGLSFSSTFQESITDSTAYSFTVPKGEKGYVIFTAYLRCSVGSGTCNGEKVEGEVCTPYRAANGELAGETSLVIEG
ncbi:uncharacterized protein PG998_000029 [Apiospora kogelbergensis]|uniref:uncharacterized protein n=1 Tax=Apiospora kogelbergensis TaxID=1337665 RepID=UPI0031323445